MSRYEEFPSSISHRPITGQIWRGRMTVIAALWVADCFIFQRFQRKAGLFLCPAALLLGPPSPPVMDPSASLRIETTLAPDTINLGFLTFLVYHFTTPSSPTISSLVSYTVDRCSDCTWEWVQLYIDSKKGGDLTNLKDSTPWLMKLNSWLPTVDYFLYELK